MEYSTPTVFQCKCGRTRVSQFFQPAPCQACKRCNTTLTPGAALSTRRLPHDFYDEEYVIDPIGTCITVGVCKGCGYIDEKLPLFTVIT
jgi:hypothetical protein